MNIWTDKKPKVSEKIVDSDYTKFGNDEQHFLTGRGSA